MDFSQRSRIFGCCRPWSKNGSSIPRGISFRADRQRVQMGHIPKDSFHKGKLLETKSNGGILPKNSCPRNLEIISQMINQSKNLELSIQLRVIEGVEHLPPVFQPNFAWVIRLTRRSRTMFFPNFTRNLQVGFGIYSHLFCVEEEKRLSNSPLCHGRHRARPVRKGAKRRFQMVLEQDAAAPGRAEPLGRIMDGRLLDLSRLY